MSKFPCTCCNFSTRHFPLLLKHYRVMHAFQHGFRICCGIDNCHKYFSVMKSFTLHIKKKHALFYETHMSLRQNRIYTQQVIQNETPSENECDGDAFTGSIESSVDGSDHNANNDGDIGNNANDQLFQPSYDYTRDIALFILTLREMKKMPLIVGPDIVSEIKDLFQTCQEEIFQKLTAFLRHNGIQFEELLGFENVFEPFTAINTTCERLSSVYKQNQYLAYKFDFVEPVEFVLQRTNDISDTLIYVPILKTLQALLKHDDVLAEIINGHFSENGHLGDFCDGDLFKAHPVFSNDHRALQIQLYCDEFQVVNPLGTKVKKFKLMGIYFVLGNLRPKQRSKLHAIQLAMLCPANLVKLHGWKTLLKPLIMDLQSLEMDGIVTYIDETEVTLHGAVSMLVADNLAAHSLAGLTESFTALRNCRFCNITRESMQSEFIASNLTLRNSATYDAQVGLIEENPELVTVYGIKDRSALNDLHYFHAIGYMPSDIAHDIFEGFASELMQIVIKTFVYDGFFTLKDMNEKIRSFPYSQSDLVNKPSPMAEEMSKFRIKQTASQTWCLLRMLPLMVGEKVPEGHRFMSLLLDFLDIVDIVCAHTLAPGDAAYLGDLVERFLSQFFELNVETSVKPKAHYLLHYAYQILKFGPLKHCWTLRFEGKHNYFKETANRTKNRRNICKTLATRHQYMQCIHYASENFLEAGVTDTYNGKRLPMRLLNNTVQVLLSNIIPDKDIVYQASSATFEGIKYSAGAVVVLGYCEDTYSFGLIDCLFDLGGSLYILVKNLQTIYFNNHFHAYVVEETSGWKLLQPINLFDSYPLGAMGEYFVIFGERKKVIKAAGKEELLTCIRRKFAIPPNLELVVQQYNGTYEDFVDVDSDEEFPDGGKLKVLTKHAGLVNEGDQSPPQTDVVQSAVQTVTVSNDNGEVTAHNMHNAVPSTSQSWPCRFELPKHKFSKRLLLALSNKEVLGPALTSDLMDVLYEDVTNFTYLPTSAQYSDVIESLMTSYPYLRNLAIGDLTLGGDSAFRKWKNILSDKFRNMRKRRDRNVPEVAAKKKKKSAGNITEGMPQPPAKSNQWGLKNYQPERPATEDDQSILKAKEWMSLESSKRRPEMSGVRLRMDLTFADRRKDVIVNQLSVSELKDNYPCLFMEEEILNEFSRLAEIDLDKSFLSGLAKYGESLLNLAKANRCEEVVSRAIAGSRVQEERNRLTGYGCLLVLPKLLKENLSDLLCKKESIPAAVRTPLLVYDGDLIDGTAEYQLIVEDCLVAEPLDLIQGFECLLASYYIFNIAYPKELMNSLTFLQKCILNLNDSISAPRKVITLMSKVSK